MGRRFAEYPKKNQYLNLIEIIKLMTIKDNNKQSKVLRLVGFIGSLASIIAFLFIFFPIGSEKVHQLTVFVTDTNGNVVLENKGRLNIPIGNRALNAPIGFNGKTNFPDITSDNLGDTITIGLDVKGWEIVDDKNTFIFTGEPIHLKVKKDDSLGIIKGAVKSRNGQEFISGASIRVNSDTIILTDSLGFFKITLPEDLQVNKETDSYLLTVSKDGYKMKTQPYFPKSSDAEIRLEKIQ